MTITVACCPFCDYDDVEITEVSPGKIAVDCPECRCIGPICDDPMQAIARWNHAPRRGDGLTTLPTPPLDIPRTPDWIADMIKRDQAREQFNAESA